MRKSNLLLMAALLIFLLSLGMYNVALKAEHSKGTYKDRYKDFITLNIKDFQALDIKTDSRLKVLVMPGDFKVRVLGYVEAKKVGNRLQINDRNPERGYLYNEVVITCPRISEINISGIKGLKQKITTITKQPVPGWEEVAMVSVNDFTLDSLLLKMDHIILIRLNNNNIGKLRSITGISPGAMSNLEINSDNTIQEADLTVRHLGKLSVFGNTIARLRHDFGDSTQISISGAALGLLKK